MKQKKVFLESEGNAWYERNAPLLREREFPGSDPLLARITDLNPPLPVGTRVLEVGCGDGSRMAWLSENLGFRCSGIDPSEAAVTAARERGVDARVGTADVLPFEDGTFDVVVFGFCLYLCDREDLFQIAAEADRVLKNPSWLLIIDFFSPSPSRREYHHRPGIFSYKMDYSTLFTWHPSYTCLSQKVCGHEDDRYTDDPAEWVATSVLRKNSPQEL